MWALVFNTSPGKIKHIVSTAATAATFLEKELCSRGVAMGTWVTQTRFTFTLFIFLISTLSSELLSFLVKTDAPYSEMADLQSILKNA